MSPSRLAAGLGLAAWAGLFWFLLSTGRSALYLSSRTSWLVPLGAVLLSVAAAGRLATARTERPAPLGAREAWGIGLVALPVVLVLSLPPATLDGFAVDRRGGFAGAALPGAEGTTGGLGFLEVAAAQTTREGAVAIRRRAGEVVTLEGFVWRDEASPADELLLTRYVVTCCVADATSAQVRVVNVPPGRFSPDDWIRVRGRIYPIGSEIVVDASQIEPIARPDEPYLTP